MPHKGILPDPYRPDQLGVAKHVRIVRHPHRSAQLRAAIDSRFALGARLTVHASLVVYAGLSARIAVSIQPCLAPHPGIVSHPRFVGEVAFLLYEAALLACLGVPRVARRLDPVQRVAGLVYYRLFCQFEMLFHLSFCFCLGLFVCDHLSCSIIAIICSSDSGST